MEIPYCKGISQCLWVTKLVTLYSDGGLPVAEGICHNVSSDLVLSWNGALGDSHIAVQNLKSLSIVDVLDEWRYSVRASPIEHVYCSGASLHDHNLHYNYNCCMASLSQPASSRSTRYIGIVKNPPRETCVKAKGLLI